MLQITNIRENKAEIIKALDKRFFDSENILNEIIEKDDLRKKTQFELDNILSELNSISKEIGILFKSKEVKKANILKEKTIALKSDSKELSDKLSELKLSVKNLLYTVPNIPNELVKKGKSENDNQEIFKSDTIINLPDNAIPHWDLAKKYDLIDFELGVKITGAGFPVYKGKGARVQRALINYFLDKNTSAGYTEIIPPLLVNEQSGIGTGQLPDKEGQMYHCQVDDLYLIPTAEVPVTNIYRNSVVKSTDFPIKMTAFTPCFRREAGSYGKDVRGLNRLHQFDKVEIVRIEHPDNSYKALEQMVSHVENILKELNLPYRILRLCGGDLGFTSAITYDFEVYSAAQEKWLEVSSVSNFETFQANRLNLKFKNERGKNQYCHTLNGSSLALPRILAAILENNQTENGITIPEALVSYTGFEKI